MGAQPKTVKIFRHDEIDVEGHTLRPLGYGPDDSAESLARAAEAYGVPARRIRTVAERVGPFLTRRDEEPLS